MKRKRGKKGKEKIDDIESRELGPSFADLPLPITTDILLRLPIKLLLICKHVCRTWNTLISDPHFAKLHFDRQRFGFMVRVNDQKLVSRLMYLLEDEPPELDSNSNNILKLEPISKLPLRDAKQDGTDGLLVDWTEFYRFHVVNSCNGLICMRGLINHDALVVCNPVTREFIRLPNVIKGSKRTLCSGIGFQTNTNEYKVVRIVYGISNVLNVEINVVGIPTWRNVRVDGNFSSIEWLKCEYPTFVNEALHWIYFAGKKYSILCFSFETEKLQLIDLPSPTFFQVNDDICMGALRDSLYVCNTSLPLSVDVWIMKNDDNEVLWTKAIITLRRPLHKDIHLYRSFKNFDNGYCILEICSENGFIYYYDNDTKNRPKKLLVCGTRERLVEVIPHIPSLISLKDVVKRDNVEVLLNVNSQQVRCIIW